MAITKKKLKINSTEMYSQKYSISLIYVGQKYAMINVPVSIYPLKGHNKGHGKSITTENQVLKLIVVSVPAYFLGSKQQMKTAGVYI